MSGAALAGLLAWLALTPAAAGGSDDAPRHGRERIARFVVPADLVAQWNAAAARAAASARDESWQLWSGPMRSEGSGRNPYTLVLHVRGKARAPGAVTSRWRAGWVVQETPQTRNEVLQRASHLAVQASAAGERVQLEVKSLPLTLKGQRDAAPRVALAAARNLDIEQVEVEVWSGQAPWSESPLAQVPREAGIAFAALGLWMLLPRRPWRPAQARNAETTAAADAAPPPPALPPIALKNPSAQTLDLLRMVLTEGVVVHNEPDLTRPSRRKSKKR